MLRIDIETGTSDRFVLSPLCCIVFLVAGRRKNIRGSYRLLYSTKTKRGKFQEPRTHEADIAFHASSQVDFFGQNLRHSSRVNTADRRHYWLLRVLNQDRRRCEVGVLSALCLLFATKRKSFHHELLA